MPKSGLTLHKQAERTLGKHDYTHAEYFDALVQAEAQTTKAASVEQLAQTILRERRGGVENLDVARVLAESKLGIHREPDDPIQVAAERLARSRGASIEAIRDYRQLAALYREAERVLATTGGGAHGLSGRRRATRPTG